MARLHTGCRFTCPHITHATEIRAAGLMAEHLERALLDSRTAILRPEYCEIIEEIYAPEGTVAARRGGLTSWTRGYTERVSPESPEDLLGLARDALSNEFTPPLAPPGTKFIIEEVYRLATAAVDLNPATHLKRLVDVREYWGAEARAVRESIGLTPDDLARALEISPSELLDRESSNLPVPAPHCAQLAAWAGAFTNLADLVRLEQRTGVWPLDGPTIYESNTALWDAEPRMRHITAGMHRAATAAIWLEDPHFRLTTPKP